MTLSREQILTSLPVKPRNLSLLKTRGTRFGGAIACHASCREAQSIARGNLSAQQISVTGQLPANTLVVGTRLPSNMRIDIPSDSDEAFALRISKGSVLLRGNTPKGLRHAAVLLNFFSSECKGRLPALELIDWPAMAVRGVMVDPARQPDRIRFYEQMVERLAPYRINVFMLYFENKLEFSRHPKLRAPVAYTLKQMKHLKKHCARYGMELVPCFATFGHCEHFLKVKEYRRLADGDRIYQLNPLHPGAKKMLNDMFDDWQTISPEGGNFHAAADEAPYVGHCRQTRDFIHKYGVDEFYARHLNFLNQTLKKRGFKTWVWADMLKHHPNILNKIDKDILLCEWLYGPIRPDDEKALNLYRQHGFDYLVCPAASRSAQHHFPDFMQIEKNIPQFIKLGLEKKCTGMLCTQWEAFTRSNSLTEPGFAFSGALAWEGKNFTPARRRALYQTYYRKDPERVERLFRLLSPHLQVKRFSRIHFDKSVKEKTYHVDTHEMLATDPLLYLKYSISPWERKLDNTYSEGYRLACELFPANTPRDRIIRFQAMNLLLIAWKRVKINQAGILFRKAGVLYRRGDFKGAAKVLCESLIPLSELETLVGEIKTTARGCWAIERYPSDPGFDRQYKQKLSLAASSVHKLIKVVTSNARALSAGKDTFDLNSYIAGKVVYLYNIKLKSREEVNIITLHVSSSRDGKNFKPCRDLGAFQIPRSDYLYMFAEGDKPQSFIKFDLRQTRTAWTPEELEISLLKLLPPLSAHSKAGARIQTEEYLLFENSQMKYKCIPSGIDSATFALRSTNV